MSRTIYVCPQCGEDWSKPHCPKCAEEKGSFDQSAGSDLTPEESKWIKRARKLMQEIPDSLVLYNIDWDITVCKKGVSSKDFSETIKCPLTSGTMLTDLHDRGLND